MRGIRGAPARGTRSARRHAKSWNFPHAHSRPRIANLEAPIAILLAAEMPCQPCSVDIECAAPENCANPFLYKSLSKPRKNRLTSTFHQEKKVWPATPIAETVVHRATCKFLYLPICSRKRRKYARRSEISRRVSRTPPNSRPSLACLELQISGRACAQNPLQNGRFTLNFALNMRPRFASTLHLTNRTARRAPGENNGEDNGKWGFRQEAFTIPLMA